jgi:spore coat protein A
MTHMAREAAAGLKWCSSNGLVLGDGRALSKSQPHPTINTNSLARFVDPLPIAPRARFRGHRPSPEPGHGEVPYYRIEMREFEAQLHRDLKPTRQWGYESSVPGPSFETRKREPIIVEWVNNLPEKHLLPVDHNIHGAEANLPEVRTVVHLHGAKAPANSDGYPEDWYSKGKSATYHYPNDQDAALLWYHDHAMGITRLNIYAGLMGLYLLRDGRESSLNLPRDQYEVPLVIYDRLLSLDSQLYYPISLRADAPWVPEVYGDTFLVNGKIYPFLEVEPRKYRLRILNGSNGRFFALSFSNGLSFDQIGTDQGLLPSPVELKSLLLFPAERADVIVDFKDFKGERIVLKHQTKEVMEFRVLGSGSKDTSLLPPRLNPIEPIPRASAVRTRTLTLGEYLDSAGNSMLMLLNGLRWDAPVTEKAVVNTVEIWNLVNLTGDAHPIHLHAVRFQILDRRPFDIFAYNTHKTIKYAGPPILPTPAEAGWKDTVRADPGMVTRIIIRFEGYPGRYVWLCLLLEHEDNEMMRPYEIIAG